MLFRATISSAILLSATLASGDEQAVVSFSGKGKQPIEVRDASGNVTEVVGQNNLGLNQIPENAAAREQAYRESQSARAAELASQRSAADAEEAARQAEAAKAAEDAAAQAAAEAEAEKEKVDPTPRKVRRNTVRGTRYIATEPVDPSLRTPDNSGIQQVPPATTTPGPKLEQPRQP